MVAYTTTSLKIRDAVRFKVLSVFILCFFLFPVFRGTAGAVTNQSFFTLDGLKSSGLFKKEDVYTPVYVHFFLHQIESLLNIVRNNPEFEEFLQSLCFDEGGCREGVDLNKLSRSHIARFINYTGRFFPSVAVQEQDPSELVPPMLFFPDIWLSDVAKTKVAINDIQQMKGKKLLVNITNPLPNGDVYFVLGSHIKIAEVDLHIIGECSAFCASYLLPAAKTSYIESYGSISYSGSLKGLQKDVTRIMSKQMEKVQSFTETAGMDSLLMDIFMDRLEQVKNQMKSESEIDVFRRFLNSLRRWDDNNEERGRQIADKLGRFLYRKGPISISEMGYAEANEFLESLSPDLLQTMRLFLSEKANYLQKYSVAFALNGVNVQKEDNYFHTKINSRVIIADDLASVEDYSYSDFIDLVSFLVRNQWYETYFHVPRAYYNIPEKDKPWHKVAPSANLLRSLGLNIQGENNVDIFEIMGNRDEVLYLDNERIKNCDFFADNVSYTTKTLKQCLKLF